MPADRAAVVRGAARRSPGNSRVQRCEGFVQGAGALLYLKSIGRGPPVLLLHGGPGADHRYFLPHLLPLARHFRLLLLDQRGCGRSERLFDPANYTLPKMVEDLEAVRRALALPRVAVLGHSFGGMLAQAYALKYPRSINRLVLAGTASSAALINADFRAIRARLPQRLRARIAAFERRGIYTRSGAYRAPYARLCGTALAKFNHARPTGAPQADYREISWEVLRAMWVKRSDFRIEGNLREFEVTEALNALRIPTLILMGEQDLVSEQSARILHSAIENSTLHIMRGAAHMMFVDQPREFLSRVERFLGGATAAGASREQPSARSRRSSAPSARGL